MTHSAGKRSTLSKLIFLTTAIFRKAVIPIIKRCQTEVYKRLTVETETSRGALFVSGSFPCASLEAHPLSGSEFSRRDNRFAEESKIMAVSRNSAIGLGWVEGEKDVRMASQNSIREVLKLTKSY